MKRIIVGIFISLLALNATAATDDAAKEPSLCFDAKTGEPAGKIGAIENGTLDQNGNGKVIYSNLATSSDGWILLITKDGELYNADPMVQHGKEFYVGKVEFDFSHFYVTINSRKMICD